MCPQPLIGTGLTPDQEEYVINRTVENILDVNRPQFCSFIKGREPLNKFLTKGQIRFLVSCGYINPVRRRQYMPTKKLMEALGIE